MAHPISSGSHTHALRYVFPFVWHTKLSASAPTVAELKETVEATRLTKDTDTPIWTRATEPPGDADPDYLFAHVADFLFPPDPDTPHPYTLPFRLTDAARQRHANDRFYLLLPPDVPGSDPLIVPLTLTEGDLYLFQSGVGLLVVELRLSKEGRAMRTPTAVPLTSPPGRPGKTRSGPCVWERTSEGEEQTSPFELGEPTPLTLTHLVRAHRILRSSPARGRYPILRVERDREARADRLVAR
ncbi:MAG: hypothetical protein AAFN13_04350, partial [Bacteroidota bacterium]